jgi:aldehyde dehydrogenase (NAD+)
MGRRFLGNLHRVRYSLPLVGVYSSTPPSSFVLDSIVNPSTGKLLTKVSEGTPQDVDLAVAAAQKAFDTAWGPRCPASKRGRLLHKLADIMESRFDELCAVEALDNGSFLYPIRSGRPRYRRFRNLPVRRPGKTFRWARDADVTSSIATIRYYAGWADKIHSKTIETNSKKFAYTLHEPFGVVGQIIPWNFPRKFHSRFTFPTEHIV